MGSWAPRLVVRGLSHQHCHRALRACRGCESATGRAEMDSRRHAATAAQHAPAPPPPRLTAAQRGHRQEGGSAATGVTDGVLPPGRAVPFQVDPRTPATGQAHGGMGRQAGQGIILHARTSQLTAAGPVQGPCGCTSGCGTVAALILPEERSTAWRRAWQQQSAAEAQQGGKASGQMSRHNRHTSDLPPAIFPPRGFSPPCMTVSSLPIRFET